MTYNLLCSYENLYGAYLKARQQKTQKHYVLKFEKDLEKNLKQLQAELITQTYKPKPLKTFIIRDPKTRKISKSKFRDRIIHHTLINIIGPPFQKSFICDSYANQIGKGTLKAVERFDVFKRKVSHNGTRPCYVLKADIKHYFEEVDHEILMNLLKRRINDDKIIWLVQQILSNVSDRYSGGGVRLEVCLWVTTLHSFSPMFTSMNLTNLLSIRLKLNIIFAMLMILLFFHVQSKN